MKPLKIQSVGDACLSFVFGGEISIEASRRVLHAYGRLRDSALRQRLGLLDLVPTYRSLAVHVEPGTELGRIAAELEAFFIQLPPPQAVAGPLHELPTVYDGEDLPRVAGLHGMDIGQVVGLHAGRSYPVAMVGFRPHFPYLIGLSPELETPRLDSPRIRVPAGAVAIGGAQTGIYPEESPGGWNLIGRTRPELLHTIRPGDRVVFVERQSL